MKGTTVHDCRVGELVRIGERRGWLTPIYGGEHVPFEIARVYYLYDVPGGATRAAHAHRRLEQLMVAILGSFDVTLDDGREKRKLTLNRPYHGLYIAPGIWRDLDNFSSGAICMVLASLPYDEADYLRNYDAFLRAKQ